MLENALFEHHAGFQKAVFESTAHFTSATVDGKAQFVKTTFEGTAELTSMTLNDTACFEEAAFRISARFDETTFRGTASFAAAVFECDIRFGAVAFQGPAWFDGATLKGAPVTAAAFEGYSGFEAPQLSAYRSLLNDKHGSGARSAGRGAARGRRVRSGGVAMCLLACCGRLRLDGWTLRNADGHPYRFVSAASPAAPPSGSTSTSAATPAPTYGGHGRTSQPPLRLCTRPAASGVGCGETESYRVTSRLAVCGESGLAADIRLSRTSGFGRSRHRGHPPVSRRTLPSCLTGTRSDCHVGHGMGLC